jgi:hypothetical protein
MFKRLSGVLALLIFLGCSGALQIACGGSGGDSDSSSTDSSSTTDDSNSDDDDSSASVDCSAATTHVEIVVCASEALLATLSDDEKAAISYDWADATAKTTWSNFPTGMVQRNGLRLGALDDESRTAAMAVAKAVLSDDGYTDFVGTTAADDYLNTSGGGSEYSSDNYYIAFIGTPSTDGDWMLQIGGHHLAYNVTYIAGSEYAAPNHLGAEPKSSFEINSQSYAPMADEGAAMVAMFEALDSSQFDYAYLDGQMFADVLIGPDNGSAVLPTDYPTGSNRGGVLVSSLSDEQKALVKAAINQWAGDFGGAAERIAEYTTDEALSDTYIAWSGTQSSGVDVDVSGTYMRIDGPRVWIELVCQSGVVIRDATHYHSVFRDKTMDYGNSL